MSEPDRPDPLATLGARIEKAQRARQQGVRRAREGGQDQSALGVGFRIGLEFVVAIGVGVALGWACDRWLGTKPWGLLGFLFLGIGAGMMSVYRVIAGLGMAVGYRRGGADDQAGKDKPDAWDED